MHQISDYLNQLEDKEIVILGLGLEGLSTYKFLRTHLTHKKIWLIDEQSIANLDDNWHEIVNLDQNAAFSTHFDHQELQDSDSVLIFKTPGIAPHNKLVHQANELKSKFSSNTDLFFTILNLINANLPDENKKIKSIGVTGTKGKSTATSIIAHVLTTAGLHSYLGGNIGIAPLSLVSSVLDAAQNNSSDHPVFTVLELSCHQLNELQHSPNYAVILDITPEHLDYYKNFNEYVVAKSNICKFQLSSDFAIFDSQSYLPKKIAHLADAQQLTFSAHKNIKDNWIVHNNEEIVDLDTVPLVGNHSILNSLPAVVIAKHLEISNTTIAKSLQSFKSLPHRLELIQNKDGVSYYNDSLSTTPVATIAAIKSFKNSSIILIAGGFDRGLDYSELAQTIVDHQIKNLILLPDTGEIILEEVEKRMINNLGNTQSMGEFNYIHVSSMQQAVRIAKESAEDGDIVLMSPASASFNLFENYQDRGDQFRKSVYSFSH
jgi:UDP-N-acetylmuramoylalanine--D-glutamate ligase